MTGSADLEARVRILEEIEAIKQLKAKYWRCADRKLPEEMADCFTEDAVVNYDQIGEMHGRSSFIDTFVRLGCRDNIVDMHHGHNAEIELTSDVSAKGSWALYFYTYDTQTDIARQVGGYYEDDYVKERGEWKIRSTKFVTVSRQKFKRDG